MGKKDYSNYHYTTENKNNSQFLITLLINEIYRFCENIFEARHHSTVSYKLFFLAVLKQLMICRMFALSSSDLFCKKKQIYLSLGGFYEISDFTKIIYGILNKGKEIARNTYNFLQPDIFLHFGYFSHASYSMGNIPSKDRYLSSYCSYNSLKRRHILTALLFMYS